MRKIADFATYAFILSVIILSVVSIFGVWNVFQDDVISKSFQTIGLLAVFAGVILVAEKFIGPDDDAAQSAPRNVQLFTTTRVTTVVVLIISAALLALIGVLSIWEVLSHDAAWKSLTSIGIIAFSSFLITILCLKREDHQLLKSGMLKFSGSTVFIVVIIAIWVMLLLI